MPRKKKETLTLPVIPLRGLMVFPHMVLHFDVGRARSVSALEQAMLKDQQVFLIMDIVPHLFGGGIDEHFAVEPVNDDPVAVLDA